MFSIIKRNEMHMAQISQAIRGKVGPLPISTTSYVAVVKSTHQEPANTLHAFGVRSCPTHTLGTEFYAACSMLRRSGLADTAQRLRLYQEFVELGLGVGNPAPQSRLPSRLPKPCRLTGATGAVHCRHHRTSHGSVDAARPGLGAQRLSPIPFFRRRPRLCFGCRNSPRPSSRL